jgi:hypothetical protein
MPDPPRYSNTGGGSTEPSRQSTAGTPRWVKVLGIIAGVVAVVLVVLALTSGPGSHGPGRHTSSGAALDRAPASIVLTGHRSWATGSPGGHVIP